MQCIQQQFFKLFIAIFTASLHQMTHICDVIDGKGSHNLFQVSMVREHVIEKIIALCLFVDHQSKLLNANLCKSCCFLDKMAAVLA